MEITNFELLREMNKIYNNIIISTGASKISEVKKVFDYIDKKKCIFDALCFGLSTFSRKILIYQELKF